MTCSDTRILASYPGAVTLERRRRLRRLRPDRRSQRTLFRVEEALANRRIFDLLFEQAFEPHERVAQIATDATAARHGVDRTRDESAEKRIADRARDARLLAALFKAEIDAARGRVQPFERQERVADEPLHLERLLPAPMAGMHADEQLFIDCERQQLGLLRVHDRRHPYGPARHIRHEIEDLRDRNVDVGVIRAQYLHALRSFADVYSAPEGSPGPARSVALSD